MKWKYAAVIASFLMVSMAFAAVAAAEDDAPVAPAMTPYENYMFAKADLDALEAKGVVPHNNPNDDGFSYTDGPFPEFQDDGSPPGVSDLPPFDHYASDLFWMTPNGPGGWWSQDAMGGAGQFAGGDTHESWIGDQNGNGIIEWITGFSDRERGWNGVDDDGDGCIDEKTYGLGGSPYAPQFGCDMIPDQIVYYETGGMVDAGGDTGDLLTNVDWYSAIQATEVYRAYVSPRWMAYQLRGFTNYPQMAGEFISYYAYEGSNGVNANPEMDSDMSDYYVGNIDARGFPGRPPVDTACASGQQLYMGITFMRDDGWVVTSYMAYEYYDASTDWNGDGDTNDWVAAYYAIDPVTGSCRDNVVNTGVYGYYPRNTGVLLMPGYTYENNDARDWDQDGYLFEYALLYHDIESTWAMKGHVYTSYTFTASVPAWGFGWWAIYHDYYQFQTFPLKFGGSFYNYVPYPVYYDTYYFLVADEDGNRHTMLPHYWVGKGQPGQTPGGECITIWDREYNYEYLNIDLVGSIADANGDGDTGDTFDFIYCPDKAGGGSYIVEPTSKFAKGEYNTPIPILAISYLYYASDGNAGGLVIVPFFFPESSLRDDAMGDLMISGVYYHIYYWLQLTKPEFEFVGSVEWAFTGDVQPGGTVVGTFVLENTGGINIKIKEDAGIENDKGFKIQGLSARDRIGPDGTMEPGETATFYFAMTISAGSPIGPMDLKIIVSYSGVTKEQVVTLPIILKMFGNEQSCYRHRQNALRTLRAFDMDDDEGMLHNLEPGDQVLLGGSALDPEDALLLLISWYENGCGGGDDVEHAHSASSSLTGHYGMGMQYWGFAPGQEEGNEGNGNGGLTGQDRKDVYGF